MTTLTRITALAFVTVMAGCGKAADTPADTPAPATTPATPVTDPATQAVTERGLPPLIAGMTFAEANSALQGELVMPTDTAGCGYAQWQDAPAGVRVMTEAGRIARIDVNSGSTATSAGARIGDTEKRIDSLYVGRVASTPHKYTNGHYLTVTPAAPADSAYRIVFETDGQKVTKYRAGTRPAVEMVEGCG